MSEDTEQEIAVDNAPAPTNNVISTALAGLVAKVRAEGHKVLLEPDTATILHKAVELVRAHQDALTEEFRKCAPTIRHDGPTRVEAAVMRTEAAAIRATEALTKEAEELAGKAGALCDQSADVPVVGPFLTTVKTVTSFFINKAVAILALASGVWGYHQLTYVAPGTDPMAVSPIPFAEVLYAGLMLGFLAVFAPFLRLLLFRESATYAESGQLLKDLTTGSITPQMKHYWFATAVCWLATIMVFAALAHK